MSPLIPEYQAPWYSRLFTSWVKPLLDIGNRRTLEKEELFPLNPLEESHKCAEQLTQALQQNSQKQHPILLSIVLIHKNIFISAISLGILHSMASVVTPFLFRYLLNFLEQPQSKTYYGLLLAGGMFISSFLSWLAIHHCFLTAGKLGFRIRAGLVGAVYQKSLQLKPESQQNFPVGTIVNLMSKDVQNVYLAAESFVILIMAIVVVIAAIFLTYLILGTASFAGILTLIISLPLSSQIARRMEGAVKRSNHFADRRVGLINDILNGIRVVKFYAWERNFSSNLSAIREQEIKELKQFAWQAALLNLIFLATPIMVAMVTFTCHVLLGKGLNVADVFSGLACFNLLQRPLLHIPNLVVSFVEGQVSIRRLESFLNLPSFTKLPASELPVGSVQLSNVSCSWQIEETATLKNISIDIKPGEFVAVVGSAGSGKSSLFSCLMGELELLQGHREVSGRIAYVSQQAWILNQSVRDNILFNADLKEQQYELVLQACCLTEDLETFASGDSTEIGERGINLSGGQKQRVSLARAVYKDADVFFLDDPFSALDNIVGRQILQQCLLGILGKKTRILVTHNLDYAMASDRIIFLEQGTITEVGTPQELQERDGKFAQMLKMYEYNDGKKIGGNDNLINLDLSGDEGDTNTLKCNPHRAKLATQINALEQQPIITANSRIIEEEERASGAVKAELYFSYIRMLGTKPSLLFIVGLFILREILSIGSDLWLAYWAADGRNPGALFLTGFILLGIFVGIITFLRAIYMALRGVNAANKIHKQLLSGVLHAPLSFFEATPSGRVLNRFSKDQKIIDQQVIFKFLEGMSTLFLLLSSVVVIIGATPLALVAIVPLVWGYYNIQKYFRASARDVNRLEAIAHSPIYAHFSETLVGASTIRAFGCEQLFILEIYRKIDQSQRALFTQLCLERWLSLRLDIMGVLLVGTVAVSAVMSRNILASGLAGLSITYAMSVTGALGRAVHAIAELEISMNSIQRTQHYANLPPEKWQGRQTINADWPLAGKIEIAALEVRYRPELEPALKGISCAIAPGEKIGVVGRTGSGKSTLLLSLFRMVEPTQGHIYIDDVDIAKIPLQELRSRLTIIPQEPVLFQGTIRTNLDPFHEFTDQQLWQSLQRAHLQGVIKHLSAGLDTDIKEGGANLSMGERQLLCLARALLKNTRILLLDEATANVDYETDNLIKQTLNDDFAHCTVVTIAHRIHTVIDADRIMAMEQGRIMEFDSPKVLLTKPESILRKMVSQSR
ncbi:ABC transporter transmembrane domain-containing protein [aff. Roholtiella sp. LEGE 12411]|uniref:ABC transporter transmembrane domain-containing protein n=1 Tax=aff. Roholtiella sp. LEGE 12411 TaxID=1828822 RepID=UPI0018805B53|nr:ABC transporter transmembrane domain-containing protein [aff. Roholtiella sp. LEGE 12411]MBE9038714.1 ATP-binding cassette domain-containing protein [aff. Roholtiella sp. LEGE 12411]